MSQHDIVSTEQIIAIVKAYSVGNPDSIVVVIPKEAHQKFKKTLKGQKFLVKLDEKHRLIYEPISKSKGAFFSDKKQD